LFRGLKCHRYFPIDQLILLKLIQTTPNKNQVVQAIKEAILAGSISPGDQIVEKRINMSAAFFLSIEVER
jgi:hypothetical protein